MNRISRKYPEPLSNLLKEAIKEMRLGYGLNNQIIFRIWDEVTHAESYCSNYFFRDGTLTVCVRSSVVRNELWLKRKQIIRAINDKLATDELFIRDLPDSHLVTSIILK